MPPRVLIFDLGGVLLRYQFRLLDGQGNIFKSCDASVEDIKNFFLSEPWLDYECGLISRRKFFESFGTALRYSGGYEKFQSDFCDGLELNEEMFDFFLKLKIECRDKDFWLLSNLNELHYEYVYGRWPGIFYNFSKTFLSFEMECRKPDPKIYGLMLKRGRSSAFDCLFIDDTEENGVYPKKIAMPFIHFQGLIKFKEALANHGIKLDSS